MLLKYNSNNALIRSSNNFSRKGLNLLDLPNELLTNIFEFMVHEDLKLILSILNEIPDRNDRLFQIVNDVAYSSIIITNYSKQHFHELDELKKIIPECKVDRCLIWPLEDILDDDTNIPFVSINASRKVYYVFGNKNPITSIHKVMRQFCKYLSENQERFKNITSEISLLLNVSRSFDTVEEFKLNFQDLNITFLNRVIRQSSAFSDLRRLYLDDGIYYSFSSQELDLSNIMMIDALQELYLNNLNLLSVENLRLPSSIITLDLSSNNIVNLEGLKIPETLRKLNLSHNSITFILQSIFPDGLEVLNLRNNRLNLLSGHIFPESIRNLDLSNNFLRDVNFMMPQELKYLNLRCCPIENICNEARSSIANNNIEVDLN